MSSEVIMPNWLQIAANTAVDTPAWLVDYRMRHKNEFLKWGFPTQKNERWKYADLSFLSQNNYSEATSIPVQGLESKIASYRLENTDSTLLVLVNGHFSAAYSDLTRLTDGVIVCDMKTAIREHETLIKTNWPKETTDTKQYPFAALNAATSTGGVFIYIPENTVIKQPFHLLSILANEQAQCANPHSLIVLKGNSELTMVEEYVSLTKQPYLLNLVEHVHLDKNAKLDHIKIQQDYSEAIHMANTFVYQGDDSQANFTNFSLGAKFARDDLIVMLQGKGANCKTGGFCHLERDNQYIDHHVDINHAVHHTNSEMLYKMILDKKSKAVFNGRLLVLKDAQKITAYQGNHNLLLSKNAEVYSKPELEIYADDVKCKHGATTGQLDQDALFYLRSRGIPKDEATRLLFCSFAEEIFARISHPSVNAKVRAQFASGF